jgi:Transposase C of IS166 homeodomain
MEIDPHNLPSEADVLQQIVVQLLQAVEDKDQLLARVQQQLAQLLRYRYGQKRERIDENQLLLFAAQIIAASQRASAATSSEEATAGLLPAKKRKNLSAVVMVAGYCPNHWSVGGWCLIWTNRNGNASTATHRCRGSGKMSANGWNSFLLPCR